MCGYRRGAEHWMKAASTLPSSVRADLTAAFSPEAVGGAWGGGVLYRWDIGQVPNKAGGKE